MRNWKELGEVPDSDEEDFDTQDSLEQPDHDITTITPPEKLSRDANTDIWAIPDSSQENIAEVNRTQTENETASLQTLPNATSAAIWATTIDSQLQDVAYDQDKTNRQPSEAKPLSQSIDVSENYAHVFEAFSNGLFPPAPSGERLPSQRIVNGPPARSPGGRSVASDLERPSPTSSVRLSRSLRPRKPIQQHPYLVESAQYQRFMKSHGMKPLRVGHDSQSTEKPTTEGDSQDQDFNGEDSQLSSRGGVDVYDASQSAVFDDPLNEMDELALSPSPRTSSPRRRQLVSSQPSNDEHTDRTSLAGDEDFPSLEELGTWKTKPSIRSLKRRGSIGHPSTRKRLRAKITSPLKSASLMPSNDIDIWNISPSPPIFRLPRGSNESSVSLPGSDAVEMRESPSRISAQRTPSNPSMSTAHAPEVMPVESDESGQNSGASESDSEIVRYNVRRIRGVLPASWLRLDQKIGRDKAQRALHEKHPDQSPERTARRGVAQPRQRSPGRSSPSRLPLNGFFFDDDDDDDDDDNDNNEPLRHGNDISILEDTDIGKYDITLGEAEEEDSIDRMLPSQKRRTNSLAGHRKTKRRKKQQTLSMASSTRKPRQQKISNLLSVSGHGAMSRSAPKKANGKGTKTRGSNPQTRILCTNSPPRLSILDVAESSAPRFIKIAARTARGRKALGKSSPSHKHINLGNRMDNVDALSTLQDWKTGRIKPRITQPSPPLQPLRRLTESRKPLHQLSLNATSNAPISWPKVPHIRHRPSSSQAILDDYVAADGAARHQSVASGADNRRRPKIVSRPRNRQPSLRPAQLETVEEARPGKPGFSARKRYLDALYRKRRESGRSPAPNRPEQHVPHGARISIEARQGHQDQDILPLSNMRNTRQKTRFRKQFVPHFQDLDAPQYVHANDPVDPSGFMPEPQRSHDEEEKLLGLYPFGLHYTHHFDIFPLDSGVFFHDTTLIGQGVIAAATDDNFVRNLASQRDHSHMEFGERSFQWGCWNETTSSEIGILFDCITQQLTTEGQVVESWQDLDKIEAARFILRYTLYSISFADEAGKESFINRLLELFLGLLDALDGAPRRATVDTIQESHAQSETYSSLLIVTLLLLRTCQSSPSHYAESLQSEKILLRLAKATIDHLLKLGLDDIQKTYEDMQRLSARQRGIRSGDVTFHSWVVVIKVLESAQIPRNGFWDTAYTVMDLPQVNTCSDAQYFETLWKRVFLLLPLGEFDNAGVVVPGLRHSVPLQGWVLPQQLLRRVFQLYQNNPRQSPSFNDYCRAIVSRCYYLVQQWGWYKCSGIIGTIFDFFGSQNLEHLRNEEVYKSPLFLENLAHEPSLSILSEDRCFHIFLKMLAMAIQYLARRGLMNDVKNLVARTLPNHNRQFSKEHTIHQHELAALRNHHDLLSTLFWSAPPHLRPPAQLIEKLVAPGSSHKEACLINLRAWNQLARFIIASGEETNSYRPFALWQNNAFQQILDQYLSAETDIQQQYLALSEDVSKNIGQYVLKSMVAQNRAAATDILQFSVTASLDVLRQASSLAAAMYCFNSIPLEKIFVKLDVNLEASCWGVVEAGIDAVDYFTRLLERALDEQYSSETNGQVDAAQTEEALLLLDQKVAGSLIAVTRRIMESCQSETTPRSRDRSTVLEKAIMLCGRIASRFIHAGICRLSSYFKSGKYALFDKLPHELDLSQKKRLPLFLATLVQNNVFDLKDVAVTMFELWITSIVKPACVLAFENRLAEALKVHNFPYVEQADIISGCMPTYSSNRDYFACCIRHMRNCLRHADSLQRKNLRSEFATVLKLVMQQMRDHFKILEMDSTEHHLYIGFVRDIVALIKSYGADICPVDDFYYQPSREYAPSVEDPQLHTAGIIAYGIRLGEGETTAAPQLFYYLLNNFKTAMVNDRLDEERKILERGMENPSILTFVINRMLPAIIQATLRTNGVWPLLEVYSGAVTRLFSRSCVPQEIPEDNAQDVLALLQAILSWFTESRAAGKVSTGMDPIQLYTFTQIIGICNSLAPTLMTWSCQLSGPVASELYTAVVQINTIADNAVSYLGHLRPTAASDQSTPAISARGLLDPAAWNFSAHVQVQTLAQHLVADVSKNWVVTSSSVTVKVPVKARGASGTQSGQGTTHNLCTRSGLSDELYRELTNWSRRMGTSQEGRARRQARRKMNDFIL